jgi:molybdate transport system substrate-binding protein
MAYQEFGSPSRRNAMKISLLTAATASASIVLGLSATAAEVNVIGVNPMKGVVQEVGAKFERDTGHKLLTKFVSGPVVKREIDGGAPFDVAISAAPVIDELIKEGKIDAATRTELAYAGVAMGVRAGAPKPDIESVEAFKRTLLQAKSIAYSAEGPSGVHFRSVLDRLGIADEVKPKLKPLAGEALARAVPNGEAELIISTMPDILVDGTTPVGPLPPELQTYVRFVAGVKSQAKESEAAKALISYLAAPEAVAIIKAKGMEPGRPK